MNKINALNNLVDITNILKEHSAVHWIQNGTLLGFYRDGDFISHDTDTDIGVVFSTFTPEALKQLRINGFSVSQFYGYITDSFEIALVRDGIKTDLFFYYENKDSFYHCVFSHFQSNISLRHDYEYEKFGVKIKNYLGHDFFVPEDELKYIVATYGTEWKTPQKQWSWYTSPFCIKHTNIWVNKDTSTEMFANWIKNE
tara:strand:+ start:922 stop:1515 length:594 start_codon:yes stop_codon:yes gene_type:complete